MYILHTSIGSLNTPDNYLIRILINWFFLVTLSLSLSQRYTDPNEYLYNAISLHLFPPCCLQRADLDSKMCIAGRELLNLGRKH